MLDYKTKQCFLVSELQTKHDWVNIYLNTYKPPRYIYMRREIELGKK